MPYKMPVASFSFLNTDKICPYQGYRRYIVKDIKFVETPQIKYGNRVHTAFEYRLTGKRQLPDDMRQWEKFCTPLDPLKPSVEVKIGLTKEGTPTGFFDDNVFLRGKIDVVAIGYTHQVCYLLDWKTGKPWEDPAELQVNALLVDAHWPGLKKIVGQFVWLKEDRMGKEYDVTNVNDTWDDVCAQMNRIEHDLKMGHFEKTPCKLCGYCQVADCEHNSNDKLKK